jgi:hypothetical protein
MNSNSYKKTKLELPITVFKLKACDIILLEELRFNSEENLMRGRYTSNI